MSNPGHWNERRIKAQLKLGFFYFSNIGIRTRANLQQVDTSSKREPGKVQMDTVLCSKGIILAHQYLACHIQQQDAGLYLGSLGKYNIHAGSKGVRQHGEWIV